ncbi:MAG: polymerase sigma-70 factor, subfamily [Streptosporangiaceae bacterium]|jgi:RNA polymerase sigma-70 factor (TIGR02960 family)|nr:polymerase sigma-70 factor, subfamily [Streptosporangiaceae bacterium]
MNPAPVDAAPGDTQVLARASAGDEQAFRELTGPYLGELQLHCYRILGSLADAEDVMQETLLAAWRGLPQYQGRASLRAWLYRIATNRCLNALRASSRRPRPQPGPPPFTPPEPTRRGEPVWLEPYPDALVDQLPDVAPGPDARYEAQETIALAFVAAVQHLAPRQRAVLLLRDVLGFRSAEVAGMLEVSEASVNSALQRARATMAAQLPGPDREDAPLPHSARERDLAARFAAAFTRGDIDGVVTLLTDDAWYTMPPVTLEYQGRTAIAGFLRDSRRWRGRQGYRLIPTRANGQPAYGCYVQDAQAPICHAHGLIVLTLEGDQISAITRFVDNSLLARFGFPRTLPSTPGTAPGG